METHECVFRAVPTVLKHQNISFRSSDKIFIVLVDVDKEHYTYGEEYKNKYILNK